MKKHFYLLKKIWQFLNIRHKLFLSLSIILSVLGALSEIILAFSTGILLSAVINTNSLKSISENGIVSYFVEYQLPFSIDISINIKYIVLSFIFFAIFSLFLRLSERRISTWNGAVISIYFSSRIIKNILKLGYPYLRVINKSDIIVLISKGTDYFLDSIAAYLTIISNLINISVLISASFLINIRAGFFVITFLIIIYLIFNNFTQSLIKDYQNKYKNLLDKQIVFVDLLLTFPRELILMFNQEHYLNDFIQNENYLRRLVARNTLSPQAFRIILENLLLILLIGAPSFLKFFINIPISSSLIISVVCFLKCFPYILVFLTTRQLIQSFLNINNDYLNLLIDTNLKLKDKKNIMGYLKDKKYTSKIEKLDKNFNLVLDGISFKYENSNKILNKVCLEFKSGNKYAIVGSSGSGKTTLLDIIAGLERPSEGNIIINGAKINSYQEYNFLRSICSYQSQKSFLLNDSIKNNILVGKDFDEDLFNLSIQISGSNKFIKNLPKGYETLISNSKIKVSGGQEQRICLARAIYCNSPILIFDEPSSSLNSEIEKEFLRNLSRIPSERLIILVTHNIESIPKDFIIYKIN